MAIRPVDLQGVIAQATQSNAVLRNAEEAPAVAQQAAQATFASQLEHREETVQESAHAEGNKVGPKGEADTDARNRRGRQRRQGGEQKTEEPESPLGLAGEGRHFIDFTA
ncbi:MAG: hypothetical protein JOZ38_10915 [Candidatus Eremiobacteraeota bacterium]|nr:hypothetical protein [Candidatus Eremiobacteraeota bacterium]